MRIIRVWAILVRQVYVIRSSWARILPLFIWVAVDIVLWGFLTRYLNSMAMGGFNFVSTLLGAVMLWDIFIRIMHGITMTFFEDVWARNFINIFSTPISISEYLAGLVLSSIATSIIGISVMVLLAVSIFKLSLLSYGMLLIPAILVLFMFGIALGIASSALVLRMGPAAEWFIWPIPAILSPFVNVLYPIDVLPQWMQLISMALPPSYVFEALRGVVFGQSPSWVHMFVSVALAFVYIICACWFFVLMYRHAITTGLIARYSAENLG